MSNISSNIDVNQSSVLFVDPTVKSYQNLLTGVNPGTEVVILDTFRDGVQQISEVLSKSRSLSSVHILSHGDAEGVQLGDTRLDYRSLDRYTEQIQGWAKHLTTDADILFYGCNVAAGGTQLIDRIDRLTGADVAASDDLTGSAALGGDWDLEAHTGAIESSLAFQSDVLEGYDAVLASFNFANFADTSSLTLNGNAAKSGNVLRVTPNALDQVGTTFYSTPVDITANTSFQTQFQFNLSGGTGGADGFTFLLQNDADGAGAIAGGGGNVGYGGVNAITNSLAIEFDTYQNAWETNNNHVALLRDGAITTALATASPTIDLNSGSLVNAWVEYNGATNRLEVFLSSTATKPTTSLLSQTIDLSAVVGNKAYLGFTGATGGLSNAQDINSWQFSSSEVGTPGTGTGNGLKGEYYDNVDFTSPKITRIDPTVNFNWGNGSPDTSIGVETFSAVWSGQVQPLYSETYTFSTTTDDGVRLFVNNQLVIDNYRDQAPTERSGTITLQAGQKYDIRMEYYENRGGAVAQLSWASATQTKQIIPQSQLYSTITPPAGGNGLKGEYFDNRDFTNLVLTRNDSTVNFDWGNGSPDSRIGNDTFSVRWTGQVQPLYTETYTFSTTTDDGLQLYVDDRLIIDNPRDQSPTERSGTITLQAGQKYNIRMDYYENAGGAVAKLAWASPSQTKQIIPQSQLFNTATNPGVLALGDTQVSVNENGATANITVVRTGGSDGVATLDYTTLDGSASAGNDYTAKSGTLTFASGVTSQVISIPILDDTLVEGNELFSVAVDRPTGATLRAPRTAQVTIVDNDVPAGETFLLDFPSFANASRLQLNGSAATTSNVLRLNNGLEQKGSAFYKDALSLDTNTSFQTQFQFRLNGGNGTNGADGFTFMLQDAAGGNLALGGIGGSLGYAGTGAKSLAIEFDTYDNGDYDPNDNSIAILRDGVIQSNLGIATAPFDLNSSVPLNAWVDYNGTTDRLEIYLANTQAKPSTPLLSQTIDLTAILGNSAYIGFSGGTGGLFNNQDIENWKFTTNAQSPTIGFSQPTYRIDEAAGTATITVRRGANVSAGAASVNYTTSNGTATAGGDYTLTSGTLNFAVGETEKTFTIAINNDTEVERNETVNITLSNPIGAALGSQNSSVLTILDNDAGNFVRETVVSNLNLPTAFQWAPGSDRLYVAEKGGVVKVIENGVTSVFLDLSDEVNSANDNDRGLLALTIHPDFANTPYIYLGYTYDPPEAATGTGLAARDQNGNRPSRLIRVTADASTGYKSIVPNSAVVLLGTNSNWAYTSRPDVNSTNSITTPPSGIVNGTTITAPANLINGNGNIQDYLATDSQSHTIGDVAFGTDGSLFVSNGDGASFGRVDPRASRVLDINNLSGKILRIDPITGAGLADNPFYQSSNPNSNASKVYDYGLRNPFRFVINPATNEPVIGDVGWSTWEEINTGKGKNFGWPYYEGGNGTNLQAGGYSELTEAQAYYATGATITPAIYARSHADGAAAISMGDYYTGTTFPSVYQGGLFFSDIVSGEVDVLLFNNDGTVNSVKRFASGSAFNYISQMTTRNSDLYFSSLQAGTISRWRAV
jgi:glucose/arabinose dehydrogenase